MGKARVSFVVRRRPLLLEARQQTLQVVEEYVGGVPAVTVPDYHPERHEVLPARLRVQRHCSAPFGTSLVRSGYEQDAVPVAEFASHDYAVEPPGVLAHHLFTADLHILSVSERSAQRAGSSSPSTTFPLGEVWVSVVRVR